MNRFLLFLILTAHSLNAQVCDPIELYPSAFDSLQTSQTKVRIHNSNTFWQLGDYVTDQDSLAGENPRVTFGGSLWMAAKRNDTLVVAAGLFGPSYDGGADFFPGPMFSPTDSALCGNWDRIFPANRADIEAHRADFADNGQIDNPIPVEIIGWPGRGNEQFVDIHGFELPDRELAPFVDVNGDGRYQPSQGDYPAIKGDQALWWIMNDAIAPRLTFGAPLKVEIGMMAYVYLGDSPGYLPYSTFYDCRITNRGTALLESTHIGTFVFPQLGCFTDDSYGCFPDKQFFYVHNQGEQDDPNCPPSVSSFVGPSPLQSYQYLETPANSVGIQNGLSAFLVYLNSDVPTPMTMPDTRLEHFNNLSGQWKDGTPMEIGGAGWMQDGETTRHLFNNDSIDGVPWTMCNFLTGFSIGGNIMGASGPFTIYPGQSVGFSFASQTHFNIAYTGECPGLDPVIMTAMDLQPFYNTNDSIFEATATYGDPLTNTEEIATSEIQLLLYPNPATNQFSIKTEQAISTLKVYNTKGQLMANITGKEQVLITTIDCRQWPNGVYYYQAYGLAGELWDGKIVKQ